MNLKLIGLFLLGLAVVAGAFLLFSNTGNHGEQPTDCIFAKTCFEISFEAQVTKGFWADPNLGFVRVRRADNVIYPQSITPFDIVMTGVDAKTLFKVDSTRTGHFELLTPIVSLPAEGSSKLSARTRWFKASELPAELSVTAELLNKDGGSWGDSIVCKYYVTSSGSVSRTGGSSEKCAVG